MRDHSSAQSRLRPALVGHHGHRPERTAVDSANDAAVTGWSNVNGYGAHTSADMGADLVASVGARGAPERGDLCGSPHGWHG
jgi:hypothetical protein